MADRPPTDATFSRFRPHPWHGLPLGPDPPRRVNVYVEITPFDAIKYEVDKESGYLRVDRPQRHSSTPPTLYGFIPRTYCGERVAALSEDTTSGDGDPLDVCVVSERPINRAEVLLVARVVGGIRTTERGEADDKIVAVLDNDDVFGAVAELDELPPVLVARLRHYFATYKLSPGNEGGSPVTVHESYGSERAWTVVRAAAADYEHRFGDPSLHA